MYLKLLSFCVFNLLAVYGFNYIGINSGYRHLVKEIKSIAVLKGKPIITRWIEQKLDHFDSNEKRTWQMRYFERSDYFKPNGPVYLFLGGEASAEPGLLIEGMLYELAKETNGVMFTSEHRYYGESQPLNRTRIEDMKYLSASQALADNAYLLKNIKINTSYENSKVVVVGGSYSGNLAAWMRLVYPNLVDAAIASSSPVLAKRDFYEYLEVVGNDYKKYGTEGCLENIENMFQGFERSFQSEDGIKRLKKAWNICEDTDLTKLENKQLFFMLMESYFSKIAQYDEPATIKRICNSLNNTKKIVIDYELYFWIQNCECQNLDFDKLMLEGREDNDDYCWVYQTCTELGYFQSSNSDHHPFTKNVPVELFDKICMALFGPEFNKERVENGVINTNNMYGGRSPNVTNVVFVNGQMDPWSALGVLKDISYDAPAVFIPGSSHCKDLLSNKDGDFDELKKARAHIKYLIKKWINADD